MRDPNKKFKCPICRVEFQVTAAWTPEFKDAVAMLKSILGDKDPLPFACLSCAPSDWKELRMKHPTPDQESG